MSAVPPDSSPIAGPAGDAWQNLSRFTPARIALGRAGGSLRTESVLDFRLSHARAKDAVHRAFNAATVGEQLSAAGLPHLRLQSTARDRSSFLRRPDLGRALHPESRELVEQLSRGLGSVDLLIIISDGLAADAAHLHAAATAIPLAREFLLLGWRIAPIVVVPFGRVKLQDEIGASMAARFSVMLLGERPGLGTPDSLGAYLTARPSPDCTDADRNCVSNIRPGGLPPEVAANRLRWLIGESNRTGRRGIQLKDLSGPGHLRSDHSLE